MVVKGRVGAKVFICFRKRLMQGQRRPVYLIVDGHPSHPSKAVKVYVASHAAVRGEGAQVGAHGAEGAVG